MRIRAVLTGLTMTLALAGVTPLLSGCGPSKPPAKLAKITPGSMPSGGSFTGVFYSPLFGNLHMVESGSSVKGKWLRPRKGQWGELEGKIDGNVLRFSWSEYVDGLVGPNSKKSGKGYFVYSRPPGDNVDDKIEGEIGRGEDEVGTPWSAVKQRNVDPDLASIGGAGTGDIGGGDWDSPNKEKGEPEPPTEPDGPADPDSEGRGDDDDAPELD